jgi:hypothetical protein
MTAERTFAEDVQSLAVELERVTEEATKRAAIRAGDGRHIPENLRGHLERSYLALGQLLAIDAAPQRTAAERRQSLDAALARLTRA